MFKVRETVGGSDPFHQATNYPIFEAFDGLYSAHPAKVFEIDDAVVESAFGLGEKAVYISPFDVAIVSVLSQATTPTHDIFFQASFSLQALIDYNFFCNFWL